MCSEIYTAKHIVTWFVSHGWCDHYNSLQLFFNINKEKFIVCNVLHKIIFGLYFATDLIRLQCFQ